MMKVLNLYELNNGPQKYNKCMQVKKFVDSTYKQESLSTVAFNSWIYFQFVAEGVHGVGRLFHMLNLQDVN